MKSGAMKAHSSSWIQQPPTTKTGSSGLRRDAVRRRERHSRANAAQKTTPKASAGKPSAAEAIQAPTPLAIAAAASTGSAASSAPLRDRLIRRQALFNLVGFRIFRLGHLTSLVQQVSGRGGELPAEKVFRGLG